MLTTTKQRSATLFGCATTFTMTWPTKSADGNDSAMDIGNGLGHLSYSTLVHAGDTWAEMRSSLETYLPQVKARVSPDQPFGVSLRISADSARTLTNSALERQSLQSFLTANGLYVYCLLYTSDAADDLLCVDL